MSAPGRHIAVRELLCADTAQARRGRCRPGAAPVPPATSEACPGASRRVAFLLPGSSEMTTESVIRWASWLCCLALGHFLPFYERTRERALRRRAGRGARGANALRGSRAGSPALRTRPAAGPAATTLRTSLLRSQCLWPRVTFLSRGRPCSARNGEGGTLAST